jgi:hypothetical protein
VSTMRTLDQVTPTWDRILPANDTGDPCNSSRFTCVLGGAAVRDNETGLVWTRDANLIGQKLTHSVAQNQCAALVAAGRKGWRLPKWYELTSLGVLPIGHPFQNVQLTALYWSDSLLTPDPNGHLFAGVMHSDGETGVADTQNPVVALLTWCVRGS